MPNPRDYLRERGLPDGPPVDATPPFRVNLDTGQIMGAEVEQPPAPMGLPDDYAARVLAVQEGCHVLITGGGINDTMAAIHRLHAFLTATERPEPTPKTTFTDE